MKLHERIRELNKTEDAIGLRNLCHRMALGGIRFQGQPVIFKYADMRDVFAQADPSIDAERFEELMQLADSAE